MRAPFIQHLHQLARRVRTFLERVAREEPWLVTQHLFAKLIYGWIFLDTLTVLPLHRELWSIDALVQPREFHNVPFDWVFRVFLRPELRDYHLLFPIAQLALTARAFLSGPSRWLAIAIYVVTMNVDNMAEAILDGGNNLVHLILFYLVLVNVSGTASRHSTARAFSNVAFAACRFQLALLYFCAAMYKLNGPLWQSGMALYYISQVDLFSHPVMFAAMRHFPGLSLMGSYAAIGVQLAFALLVWVPRLRPWVLGAAAMLHVGIAFGMGLFGFGLAMLAMYTAFFSERISALVLSVASRRAELSVWVRPECTRLRGIIAPLVHARVLTELKSPPVAVHGDDSGDAALLVVDRRGTGSFRNESAVLRIAVTVWWLLPFMPLLATLAYIGAFSWWLYPAQRGSTVSAPETNHG